MTKDEIEKKIDELFEDGTEIDEAVQEAVKQAVLQHKLAGNPIVGMKDGKMTWIMPEEI